MSGDRHRHNRCVLLGSLRLVSQHYPRPRHFTLNTWPCETTHNSKYVGVLILVFLRGKKCAIIDCLGLFQQTYVELKCEFIGILRCDDESIGILRCEDESIGILRRKRCPLVS